MRTLIIKKRHLSNKFTTDWKNIDIAKPSWTGTKVYNDIKLKDLVPYIDWSPFFWTWQLKGLYPKILSNSKYGKQAKELYDDAQVVLKRIVENNQFKPKAVIGIWNANTVGEDVNLYTDETKKKTLSKFHFLRQQKTRQESKNPYYSLSDFIAPVETNRDDYLSAFAVTVGNEFEEYAKIYQKRGDDYTSILVKAIGDRFAEALAEYMHKEVRNIFSFGLNENLDNNDLIQEKYRGIRPAHGYPSSPDHTEKRTIWELLDVEKNIGAILTQNCAMSPASSVSGLYFNHPDSKYFALGLIDHDQVKDYAQRKNISLDEAKRWLSPHLKIEK